MNYKVILGHVINWNLGRGFLFAALWLYVGTLGNYVLSKVRSLAFNMLCHSRCDFYNPFLCDPAGWRCKISISLSRLVWWLFGCGLWIMDMDLMLIWRWKISISVNVDVVVGLMFVWKINLILMLIWCCCWFNVDVDLIFLLLIWWLCCTCFYAGVDKVVDWINSQCLGPFRLQQSRD